MQHCLVYCVSVVFATFGYASYAMCQNPTAPSTASGAHPLSEPGDPPGLANSGAARAVLEAEFGTGPNPLTMTSATAPGVTHKWSTIAEYAEEVSLARIYGGLPYRNSTVVGKAMGKKIGELAVQNYLKRVQ